MTLTLLSIILALFAAIGLGRYMTNNRSRSRLRADQPSRFGFSIVNAVNRFRPRRRVHPVDDLPRFIDDISRRCSSGDSLSAAFSAAAQGTWAAQVFAPALKSLSNGATLNEALRHQPMARNDDVLLTWHVLKLCALHGGILSEPLDRAAATLRGRQAISHEREAQSAQARLSAKVLTIAPITFAVWTALTTPTVREFFASPAGAICVATGALLNIVGWMWMNRIVGATS